MKKENIKPKKKIVENNKLLSDNKNRSVFEDERGLLGAIVAIGSVLALLGSWALQAGEVAIGSLLGIISILTTHPLMAYIFVIFFMFGDIALTGGVLPAGFVGTVISQVLSILGLNIVVTTPMLLVIIVIFPLLMFALNKSGR